MQDNTPRHEEDSVLGWLDKLRAKTLALIAGTIAAIGAVLIPVAVPEGKEWTIPARLLLLSIEGVALCFFFAGLSYLILWRRKNKLLAQMAKANERFVVTAITFDLHANPRCPKCDSPMDGRRNAVFHCPTCDKYYTAYDPLLKIRLQRDLRSSDAVNEARKRLNLPQIPETHGDSA